MSKSTTEYSRQHKRKQRLNPEFTAKEKQRNKEWREQNKDAISLQKKEYYKDNLEEVKEKKRLQYMQRRKRFLGFNTELTSLVHNEAKRLVKQRNQLTGIAWSVDHTLPLVGSTVSGLHVWNNIQVIPLIENKRKYNSYEEDCFRL
jgi:hypothetical protein